MDINDIYQSDSLKAADLKGREHTLCIATVESKKFNDGAKLVITFQNAKKSFVVNRTNAKRIAFTHGTNTDGWAGKEIVLYPDLVEYQGQTVEAIRVRPVARQATAAAPRQVSVAGGQAIQERGGYTISTGTERHPNAPGNNELDDPIPF
jgi:hypothetical protein